MGNHLFERLILVCDCSEVTRVRPGPVLVIGKRLPVQHDRVLVVCVGRAISAGTK